VIAGALIATGCNLSPGQIQQGLTALLNASQTEVGKQVSNQLLTELQAYVDVEAAQSLVSSQGGVSALLESFTVQAVTQQPQQPQPQQPQQPRPVFKPPTQDQLRAKLPAGVGLKPENVQNRPQPPANVNNVKTRLQDQFKGKLPNPSDATKKAEFQANFKAVAKPKLQEQQQKVDKRVEDRGKKITFEAAKLKPEVSTADIDPFGEVRIVAATMDLKVKDHGKLHVWERYYDENNVLVRVYDLVKTTFKKGAKHEHERERINNDDGSYSVTVKSSNTGPNGKTRSSTWTRTGSADGSESGTGTIKRADGTETTVTFTKTADGVTTTKTTDTAKKVAVEVKQTEGSSEATVTTSDTDKPENKETSKQNTDDLEPED
jgi:hypothetical protein